MKMMMIMKKKKMMCRVMIVMFATRMAMMPKVLMRTGTGCG